MNNAADSKIISRCILILTGIAISFTLFFAKPVLIPFIFAIFLSYAVLPIANVLQTKIRISRLLSILLTILIGVMILFLLGMLIFSSLKTVVNNIDNYQQKVVQMGIKTAEYFNNILKNTDSEEMIKQLSKLPIGKIIKSTLGNFTALFSNILLILIFFIYLISSSQPNKKENKIYKEISLKVQKYISLKVLISTITGFLVGLILWIIGLDLAFVFGILTFLLNFIPSIGSIIAIFLPIPLALVQFESMTPVILCIAIPGVIQIVIGNIIEPKLMGDLLKLHPITIILSLIFWGMIWGIMGLFIAVPITAVIRIVLDQIEQTRSFAQLMTGKIIEKVK